MDGVGMYIYIYVLYVYIYIYVFIYVYMYIYIYILHFRICTWPPPRNGCWKMIFPIYYGHFWVPCWILVVYPLVNPQKVCFQIAETPPGWDHWLMGVKTRVPRGVVRIWGISSRGESVFLDIWQLCGNWTPELGHDESCRIRWCWTWEFTACSWHRFLDPGAKFRGGAEELWRTWIRRWNLPWNWWNACWPATCFGSRYPCRGSVHS